MSRLASNVACFTILLASTSWAQLTQRVSVGPNGAQANSDSMSSSMSADGRYVAFSSRATNLLAGPDANGTINDIFVRDRWTNTTELVSQSSSGIAGNDNSYAPRISADGRYVVFASRATNLVATPDVNDVQMDVFVRDRVNGTTELISVSSAGVQGNGESSYPAISADGRFVSFASSAHNLIPNDTNFILYDVYVRDRQNGTTEVGSVSSSGELGNGNSLTSAITPDGRFVAFQSGATNLTADVDSNGNEYDIFVHDRVNNTTELVSKSTEGIHANDYCYNAPAITPDGRFVVFLSRATNLIISGDLNGGADDVFLRDRWNGTTELIDLNNAGDQGNAYCPYGASISANGRFVAFSSLATNLVDTPDANGSKSDVFLRDRFNSTTELISVSTAGVQSDGESYEPVLSPDARFVAFWSIATNLDTGDTNATWDVFVRDRSPTAFISACDPGVGSVLACPCSNPPSGPGRGCDNSAATGGAALMASGFARLAHDTVVFTTSGEKPGVLSVLLQGNGVIANGTVFGQGVGCVGGTIIRRLFYKTAFAGSITAPDFAAGDPTVSSQSLLLGDPIQPGESRYYLVYYRDATVLGGCPATSMFNGSQSGQVLWSP